MHHKSERKTRHKIPVLITQPHASYAIPPEIRKMMQVTDYEVKDYCDPFTHLIYDVPDAHVLTGEISRFVTDLNRAPDHIIAQAEMSFEGVVAAVTVHGKPIFRHPPNIKLIKSWIRKYHHPFHRKIKQTIPKVKFLIDGHSMYPVGPVQKPDAGKKRADIVLGNREYTSCSLGTTLFFKRFFEKRGYHVKINDPYGGKYILGAYCSRHRLPGIQIEVNEGLYLDRKTLKYDADAVARLNREMNELVHELVREHLRIKG